MRTQLAVPENDFLDPRTYNQFFTMHGTTMMFLFVIPFIEAVANYFLPLLLGARDLPFPRMTTLGSGPTSGAGSSSSRASSSAWPRGRLVRLRPRFSNRSSAPASGWTSGTSA